MCIFDQTLVESHCADNFSSLVLESLRYSSKEEALDFAKWNDFLALEECDKLTLWVGVGVRQ